MESTLTLILILSALSAGASLGLVFGIKRIEILEERIISLENKIEDMLKRIEDSKNRSSNIYKW